MSAPAPRLRAVEPAAAPRSLAMSTLVVMSLTLFSTFLGFGREVMNARYYGTEWQMDTFLAAATIPTIIFGIFNGALVSALVPAFSEYFTHGRDDDAWRLANTIINVLAMVLVVATLIGWFGAPLYVPFVAHGFNGPQMGQAIRMTQWLMVSIIGTSLAGVLAALLNAQRKFVFSAMQGIALNVVTIGTVVFLFPRQPNNEIYALVYGTAAGLISQLLVQLPPFLAMRRYRFEIDLKHPGLQRVYAMLGPIIVGSAAGQVALFFDRFFASSLQPGFISSMNYATKLVNFPQQIFATAIATVIFPLLATQFAEANRSGIRRTMSLGLRLVLFITVPAVCGLVMLAHPIVETLFERGSFDARATNICAELLPFAAIGLVCIAANIILSRCCFACRETRWPVAISIVSVIFNIVLSLLWLPKFGAKGLLLANASSQGLQTLALAALVWRLVRGFDVGPLARSFFKIVLASLGMVFALHFLQTLGPVHATTLLERSWYLLGELVIGAFAFLAVALAIRVEELHLVIGLVVQKFASNTPSAPEDRGAPIA